MYSFYIFIYIIPDPCRGLLNSRINISNISVKSSYQLVYVVDGMKTTSHMLLKMNQSLQPSSLQTSRIPSAAPIRKETMQENVNMLMYRFHVVA